VAVAALCEKVLEEKDGVLSAIRIVDRVTSAAQGTEPPPAMPPLTIQLFALIILRPDKARGRFRLTIRPEDPSGSQLQPYELPLHLDGEERGAQFKIEIGFVADLEGLYWFDVEIDGTRLTRMPLRVVYAPTTIPH
jgi:hypothetical protein